MKQSYLYFFLIVIPLFVPSFGRQQVGQASQDSLEKALDRQRVDVFLELADKLKDTDPAEAAARARQAYDLSKESDYAQGIVSGSYFLGRQEREARNYRRAARLVEEGVEAARSINDPGAELQGLALLIEIYRLAGRDKKRAETELAYEKLHDQIELSRKALQLTELKQDFARKEATLQQTQAEKENIQEALNQTVEERLQKETELARLAQEKAELEVKTLEMEREAAQSALQISEKEKELQAYNARLQKQRLLQTFLLAGLAVAALVIVLIVSYHRLKRSAEKEQRRARQQLEMQEKMATLGQLSAGIAHEIKNPLNFVNNFALGTTSIVEEMEEYLAEAGKPLENEQVDYLQELIAELKQNAVDIRDNGRRIDRIVTSMMDHARDAGGERRTIDVNSLVRENVNLAYLGFRALHPAFTAKIEADYDPAQPKVEGVSQDLGRVLINIVNNACYAMHNKRTKQGKNDATLRVSTRTSNKEAVISIWDNGPGISAKDREHIFAPFFTTKPTGEGNAGLGLSISYDIVVQQHGGDIKVESEPGKYAEFVISLPMGRPESETANAGERAPLER
jgi:signal transduction histidine kinase